MHSDIDVGPADTGVRTATSSSTHVVVAVVRVLFALLWLQNVLWKIPPDFGANRREGLWEWVHKAVEYPVFPPYSFIAEQVILPALPLFGWLVILIEGGLGVFLLIGFATRFWAVVAILQTCVIMLSVLNAPGEWPWSYYLMAMTAAMLWATAAGRSFGLDAVVRPRMAQSSSRFARLYRWIS